MRYTVTFAANLMPMPRPRVNRRGGVGFPSSYRIHREALTLLLGEQIPKVTGACRVLITVAKPCEATSQRFGDADNLAKTVLDALPFPDQLVIELQVRKVQAPGYQVTITVLTEPESTQGR